MPCVYVYICLCVWCISLMTQLYTSDAVCYTLQALFKKKNQHQYCVPLLSFFTHKEMANIGMNEIFVQYMVATDMSVTSS